MKDEAVFLTFKQLRCMGTGIIEMEDDFLSVA